MKREAKFLLDKSIDSLIISIEHFNRPWDLGRKEVVLILLDRSFELFLKASIIHLGGEIREKQSKKTIGFDKCVRKCISDENLKIFTEDEALAIQIINSLRDAAQHYLLELSEQEFYTFTQAGVSFYKELLEKVFNKDLSDCLPERVLPISTSPPKSFETIIDAEFEDIKQLVSPGSRQTITAKAKLRSLAIIESSLEGEKSQPSDKELNKTISKIKGGKDWREIFPGVANLNINTEGTGLDVNLRITKTEGEPVHLVPEGDPDATVVAIKRVNEAGYYSMGLNKLAEKVNLTPPKTLALIKALGIQDDIECFKVLKLGKIEQKRYSPKALDLIKKKLPELDMEDIWKEYGAYRK